MSVKLLRLSVLCLPLLALSACGEGWEAQKTDTYLPYGNSRTAGPGVVYVRAKMMPEKDLKVESVAEEPAVEEPVAEPAVIAPADEIFTEAQTKGGVPVKREAVVHEAVESVVEEEHSAVDVNSDQSDYAEVEAVEPSAVEPASAHAEQALSSVVDDAVSAEEYISQAPKQIEIPEVKIVEDVPAKDVEEISAVAPPPPGKAPYETYNKTLVQQMQSDAVDGVVTHKETVEAKVEEVVSPNKDYVLDGHRSLNEIYEDPF